MQPIQYLQLHHDDNVLVATVALTLDTELSDSVTTTAPIPYGHKVANQDIAKDTAIIKYGQYIGSAIEDIKCGEHVHDHNLAYRKMPLDKKQNKTKPLATVGADLADHFLGYKRANGKAGTRNYVGIMSTVNCTATLVSQLAHKASMEFETNESFDGFVPIVHQSGCGIPANTKVELSQLQRLLSGFLHHSNFAAWLIVGLGCEVNQIKSLLANAGIPAEAQPTIKTIEIQAAGGTAKSLALGLEHLTELVGIAQTQKREPIPVEKLTLGLQCGGSDAWSGICANPALGAASDILVSKGGSSILAETPEVYGAEQLLYERTLNSHTVDKLAQKIDWWQHYAARNNSDLNNNPSPGNLAGGITSILEKSLGAVAKAGQAPLMDVLEYGQPLTRSGLNFMDSPGFDPCSVTGEMASGANIICFTTGRGSVFGAPGAPCLKLASNTPMYQRMTGDMDINCGQIADGEKSIELMGEEIYRTLIDTASGRLSKSELAGLGAFEFVPWQQGMVV